MHETKHLRILERDGWEYVERKKAREAVAVIAVTDGGELILTEQYRRAVDAPVIDLPAGLVEEHPPAETAKLELEEETGFTCESVDLVAKGPTSPGITSELVSFYRARGVRRVGEGGGVGGENITVHTVPLGEIDQWLMSRDRALVDVKVWAGLCLM